jgi:sugar O-acyltransferase (sialic acid O-acetyltransferase NeuD family)
MNAPVLIGYSGHGFVVADVLTAAGTPPVAYCDREEKTLNPYGLPYWGDERAALERLRKYPAFVAIGDGRIRERITQFLVENGIALTNAVHPSATISPKATLGTGVLVCSRVVVHPLARLGDGAIANTACLIEHECLVGAFAQIAPGAILCGNVTVGEGTLIGAGAVVLPGVTVGASATVGAGAIVRQDVPNGATVVGNPARLIPPRTP